MRGYLEVEDGDGDQRVPVDSAVGVYRDPERSQRVVVETERTEVPLDVADVTVSRKSDGTAPIRIVPRSEFVEIRNEANSNGLQVRAEGEGTEATLDQGRMTTVTRDSIVEVGYQTRLRLVVERERKNVVHHEGEGDVEIVGGDKQVRNVDASTEIEDAVINRSSIGDGSVHDAADEPGSSGAGETDAAEASTDAGTHVEDAVVNRSAVGTESGNGEVEAETETGTEPGRGPESVDEDRSDTKNFCGTHEIAYRGDQCPQCRTPVDPHETPVRDGSEARGRQVTGRGEGRSSESEPSGPSDGSDSRFCIHCGESIPGAATHCPECGGRQR